MGNCCGREDTNDVKDTSSHAGQQNDIKMEYQHALAFEYKNVGSKPPPIEPASDLPPPPYTSHEFPAPNNARISVKNIGADPGSIQLPRTLLFLESPNQGRPVLSRATELGQTFLAQHLVEKGADVNATDDRGRPVLSRATELGHIPLAQLLVAKGADINATDDRGRPVLSRAMGLGHTVLAQQMLKAQDNESG